MPYSITTKDGITVRNIPDDVPSDSIELKARVEAIRRGEAKGSTAVDQIPGQAPDVVAPAATRPINTAPQSLGDQAVGIGEAGLALATGATGGAVGMVAGTATGLAEQILSGQFGTEEAARAVERAALQGASSLTYQPRTAAGQDMTEAAGGFAQQFVPVAGLAPQLAALGRSAQPASVALSTAARAAPGAVAEAVQPAVAAVGRAIPRSVAAEPAAATVAEVTSTARSAAAGSKKAADILATQAAPDPQIVKSAERLGISDYLQPDHMTTSDAYRQVVGAIKSNPQTAVALAEREGLSRVAQRATQLIDEIGGTDDLSTLSANVKASMQENHAAMLASEDGIYAQLRNSIPAKSDATATEVLGFIQKRADDLRGDANLSPLEQMVVRKLSPREDGSLPSYALLDDVRKDIGAAARQQGAFRDADTGLAKKLYEAVTRDQENAAASNGMGALFKEARAATVLRKGLEDDLASLFGKNLDRTFVAGGDNGLTASIRQLGTGDAARLARLVSVIPPALRQQVVASGVSTVFRNAASRGDLNFTTYAKWYEGLRRNRQAYSTVMANLPLSAQKQLAALAKVSKGVSDSLAARTKTGALNTIKAEMMGGDSLMESLYSIANRAATGAAAEAATSAVGLPGAGVTAAIASALMKGKPKALTAVDALVASPEFLQIVKAKAGSPQQKVAVRAMARSPAFSRLLRSTGQKMTLSEREVFIVQAMQANAGLDERRQRTIH